VFVDQVNVAPLGYQTVTKLTSPTPGALAGWMPTSCAARLDRVGVVTAQLKSDPSRNP